MSTEGLMCTVCGMGLWFKNWKTQEVAECPQCAHKEQIYKICTAQTEQLTRIADILERFLEIQL